MYKGLLAVLKISRPIRATKQNTATPRSATKKYPVSWVEPEYFLS